MPSSDWKQRLTRDLEPVLRSPNLAPEISTYQGVPFALFAYPPTAELELRREVGLLRTRLESSTTRRVTLVALADLMWEAVDEAYGPGGEALFDAERAMGYEPTVRRLEMLQGDMEQLLASIPDRVIARSAALDPAHHILFLVRVGALYPAYRASALLENLMYKVKVPTILFYPGTRSGRNMLRFMDSLEAIHSYRHKIY